MKQHYSPRIVLCGTVHCTELIAKKLAEHNACLVAVAGVKPEYSKNISGYIDMSVIAEKLAVPYCGFKNINEKDCVEFIRKASPDILFVTGLSQLVKDELMTVPRTGVVGFHPTPLPKGRGRAPISWLTHDTGKGAATFFALGNGVDNGDIFVQEYFIVSPDDHASDTEAKMLQAASTALDRWLPQLIRCEWNPLPQDDSLATYNEIRKPDDGIIDWTLPAPDIYALIRAASRPHPGAYTFIEERKIIIWRAEIDKTSPIRGIPGRILRINGDKILVQTGSGILVIKEWETEYSAGENNTAPPVMRIGMRLGYNTQNEIYGLRQRITNMERLLETLTAELLKQKSSGEK